MKALLFWDRCSELSADRAAVLCDGSADKTVDMLLKIHGYYWKNKRVRKEAMDAKKEALRAEDRANGVYYLPHQAPEEKVEDD